MFVQIREFFWFHFHKVSNILLISSLLFNSYKKIIMIAFLFFLSAYIMTFKSKIWRTVKFLNSKTVVVGLTSDCMKNIYRYDGYLSIKLFIYGSQPSLYWNQKYYWIQIKNHLLINNSFNISLLFLLAWKSLLFM